MQVTNLSQFKKYLSEGGAIELTDFATYSDNYREDGSHEGVSWNRHQAHRGYGVIRKAEKVQTKSVKLTGGSWLDLDPARFWTFDGNTATRTQITENYHGGYDEDGTYNYKKYKRSEHGNKLVYTLKGVF